MALRLVQIVLQEHRRDEIAAILSERDGVRVWSEPADQERGIVRVLLTMGDTQWLIDTVQTHLGGGAEYHFVILPVEGAHPPLKLDEETAGTIALRRVDGRTNRVSREELYTQISLGAQGSRVFVAMTVLSSVVAAAGLLRDDIIALIGAMVIAPLLSPNVALALATTLGDKELARRALGTTALGVGIALSISIALGLVLEIDPTTPAIAARTQVGISDIALALAAGAAGTLAFTSGAPSALIGVMVAVALLPPLINFGILFGSGHHAMAPGALLLVVTNLVCVNCAGVVTFMLQGVWPRRWWEAEKAKRATRRAVIAWIVLLAVLGVVLFLSSGDR